MPTSARITTLALCVVLAGCGARGDSADPVARGAYLVRTMGCADCHSPHGPDGRPIEGRDLTGHPADAPLPSWEPTMLERHGMATIAATATAFAGPFGVSVAPNLTPCAETGIAKMTADDLVRSFATGNHWELDRPVLPPMPMPAYRHLEERDVRAIHAYLHSLAPVRNAAPRSVPAARH